MNIAMQTQMLFRLWQWIEWRHRHELYCIRPGMESVPIWKRQENPRLPFEIIEIGAVKLDEEKKCAGEFHRLIHPMVYKRIHYRTKRNPGYEYEDAGIRRLFTTRSKIFWSGAVKTTGFVPGEAWI